MIRRYQTDVMNQQWSEENKYRHWLNVELTYLEEWLKHHPENDEGLLARLHHKARSIKWPAFIERLQRYELDVKHDVIAFLHAVEDEFGADARLIHVGLTSSDIVDTAYAILLREAAVIIKDRLHMLISTLWLQAQRYKKIRCLGRTHGQAAEPLSFGIKLLSNTCEFIRDYERLEQAISAISVGKYSGAVGVYAHNEPHIEEAALNALGLKAETIASQIVARDRHAQLYTTLAVLAGSIERLAVEIRLLSHGDIAELREPFSAKQKGSSAMPHKKNPIQSENLTGLMRMVRSYALVALENQALWHERDISHSSTERIIGPDATSIMEFALVRLTTLVENLVVNEDVMKEHLNAAGDLVSSQRIMLALITRGHTRQQAYDMVQKLALNHHGDFKTALTNSSIGTTLGADVIDDLVKHDHHLRHEDTLYARVENLMQSFTQSTPQFFAVPR